MWGYMGVLKEVSCMDLLQAELYAYRSCLPLHSLGMADLAVQYGTVARVFQT